MRNVDYLLNDRFDEYQGKLMDRFPQLLSNPDAVFQPTKSKGTLKQLFSKPKQDAGFMREFFDKISSIQATINKGKAHVALMSAVLDEMLQATTQKRERDLSARLEQLVQETNEHLRKAKDDLEELRDRCDEEAQEQPDSSEAKIRSNMQSAMVRKHHQLLVDFQLAQTTFKEAFEDRQKRELKLLLPESTNEEVEEMIQNGQTREMIIQEKMGGCHVLILDELHRLQEKNRDIRRLEESMANLKQMYEEMAVMVTEDGEILDSVMEHVLKTKKWSGEGRATLKKTRERQHLAQKRVMKAALVGFILCFALIVPIVLNAGSVGRGLR